MGVKMTIVGMFILIAVVFIIGINMKTISRVFKEFKEGLDETLPPKKKEEVKPKTAKDYGRAFGLWFKETVTRLKNNAKKEAEIKQGKQ
jgi:Na+-transporting methylmalonyl-CoA/oxaloacetate decarboxylase gamma subunit